jgi:hypothetical protein
MIKPAILVICVAAGMAAGALAAEDFPKAEISNGVVTAKFYLPDPARGYYRGTRFDWSGVIYSLRTQDHEYFGQWFERYDPKLHDAIMGPVEEFKTNNAGLGFDEAKAGGTFIRIGVGVVRKPDDQKYEGFKTYEIVDPGKRKVRSGQDWIQFVHELRDQNGYAYRYTKTIRLVKGKPEMVLEHSLKNIGKKPIQTSQYNHNFFVIDGKPTGPDSSVKFPFDLHETRGDQDGASEVRTREITYTKELKTGDRVYKEFDGFGKTSSDYDLRLENRAAGAGVRITGDQPLSKMVFWSIRTVFSPEPYIDISVAPGREYKWKYTYDFYKLTPPARAE